MKQEKQLYQWDVNQYLTELQPTAEFVDYPIGNEVIRIETEGKRCRIPDEFLQTAGFKTCYERYSDGTYKAYSFNVQSSPKPPDYVYTAEERTTFDALVAKADAAIEEIKRRADSGEFTPVKGVDYFTDAEKAEMMESVSDGAIGEFRNVVDTATTEYNANAAEKLTTYDTNAEQHTTDYNRNAEQKLEAYNSNHAAKVAEYNANAETKTAEFDSNAAALQTEVDRLRGECDTLAAENRKQENRIDALMNLNKGQTYDIMQEDGETASRTAPSGAKYVGIDMVGGKSVVWNQIFESKLSTSYGVKITSNSDGSMTLNGTSEKSFVNIDIISSKNFTGHKYMIVLNIIDNPDNIELSYGHLNQTFASTPVATRGIHRVIYSQNTTRGRSRGFAGFSVGTVFNEVKVRVMEHDLTQMFGAGNEPSTIEEFEAMFPADYYPYSEPTIISSQTDMVEVASADGTITQQITTGFPVLNSAGSVYDYIDLNEGKHRQRVGVVDLGTIDWEQGGNNNKTSWVPISWRTNVKPVQYTNNKANIMCNKYCTDTADHVEGQVNDKTISVNRNSLVYIYDSAYISVTPQEFKEAMSGVMLYYELAEEIITDIEIQTELSDWLTVEAGGSVTFHNADETKQLAVPNAVSWVRKLDEVN